MLHNSDTAVKPIIGNKQGLTSDNTQYNKDCLTFEPFSNEKIVQLIDTSEIEKHLQEVYNCMATNTTMNEKINALLYFESIIVNSNVANRLINSAFISLFLKMLKSIKSPVVRIRVCSVIGLLIRHATVIDNDLAESNLVVGLVETMQDKNEQVRRRAMAALGEYLFYAATQLDDEQVDPVWKIQSSTVKIVINSIKPSEDEYVRLFACKTLENICA